MGSPHCQMWGRKQIVCNANIKNDHSEHLKVVICGNRTRLACPPLPRFTGADSPGSSPVTPFLEAIKWEFDRLFPSGAGYIFASSRTAFWRFETKITPLSSTATQDTRLP